MEFNGRISDLKRRPIQLQRQTGKGWTNLATGRTRAAGKFAFTGAVPVNTTTYRVYAPKYKAATGTKADTSGKPNTKTYPAARTPTQTITPTTLPVPASTPTPTPPGPPMGEPPEWVEVLPPVISGDAQVGSTLIATIPPWTPEPTSVGYQWLSDSVNVPGATGPSYVVSEADAGASMTVAVTGSKPGYPDVTRTSEPVSIPAAASFDWLSSDLHVDSIQGSVEVGTLGFTTTTISGLTFEVDGDLADLVDVDVDGIVQTADGYTITYRIDSGETPGHLSGTIVAGSTAAQLEHPSRTPWR